eukprot:CAMPEP_0117020722 /NCGR_PEP_ID=MMETSP0472-20121206/15722_1 /TAXON_ID=693140 ORGANISM="Tiarina fusus, Strain LIS" /NCGR_SAMPLE_ID=MMETSP0472 /ASSEMBLY_ACC=CAM_ASM_000603 /LENGTH=329 /DNA_ID=CAMNT_0004726015 /DNA_START=1026 /DNA_END=2012 /DNA_ORIENTATION=-
MTNLLRLSLDDNPLDANTLEVIQKDGALALVNREPEDSGGSKKFESFQRRTSMRSGFNKTLNPRGATLNTNFMRSNSVQSFKVEDSKKESGLGDSPKTAKKKEKSKDAETGVPSYSTFKFAFDSLLEQQDFSKKKKEMLKKMSEKEKWSLLNQYKGSTLELLRNQPKKEGIRMRRSTATNQKSAVDFVTSLKEGRVNKNTMNRTKASLKDNKSGWASKFVEAGGIAALSQYLTTCTQKSKLSARDHSMIKDCLELFKILLDVSFKSVLTSSGAVASIAIPLSLDNSDNNAFSVKLLEEICSKEIHVGAQLVFEAITTMSKKLQEEMPFF